MTRCLNSADGHVWRQRLLQLLGLLLVVDNQSVLVLGASDLKLGLLGDLAAAADHLVCLDDRRLDVFSSGQLNELLDVFDLFLYC